MGYGTSFIETEILLAVQVDDYPAARDLIGQLKVREMKDLRKVIQTMDNMLRDRIDMETRQSRQWERRE
jgi:hypothetical protein